MAVVDVIIYTKVNSVSSKTSAKRITIAELMENVLTSMLLHIPKINASVNLDGSGKDVKNVSTF